MPSGTPSTAPGSAGMTWAAVMPRLTCCGVEPSWREPPELIPDVIGGQSGPIGGLVAPEEPGPASAQSGSPPCWAAARLDRADPDDHRRLADRAQARPQRATPPGIPRRPRT